MAFHLTMEDFVNGKRYEDLPEEQTEREHDILPGSIYPMGYGDLCLKGEVLVFLANYSTKALGYGHDLPTITLNGNPVTAGTEYNLNEGDKLTCRYTAGEDHHLCENIYTISVREH